MKKKRKKKDEEEKNRKTEITVRCSRPKTRVHKRLRPGTVQKVKKEEEKKKKKKCKKVNKYKTIEQRGAALTESTETTTKPEVENNVLPLSEYTVQTCRQITVSIHCLWASSGKSVIKQFPTGFPQQSVFHWSMNSLWLSCSLWLILHSEPLGDTGVRVRHGHEVAAWCVSGATHWRRLKFHDSLAAKLFPVMEPVRFSHHEIRSAWF